MSQEVYLLFMLRIKVKDKDPVHITKVVNKLSIFNFFLRMDEGSLNKKVSNSIFHEGFFFNRLKEVDCSMPWQDQQKNA